MEGFETCRAISSDPRRADLPVLVLTSRDERESSSAASARLAEKTREPRESHRGTILRLVKLSEYKDEEPAE